MEIENAVSRTSKADISIRVSNVSRAATCFASRLAPCCVFASPLRDIVLAASIALEL